MSGEFKHFGPRLCFDTAHIAAVTLLAASSRTTPFLRIGLYGLSAMIDVYVDDPAFVPVALFLRSWNLLPEGALAYLTDENVVV